MNTSHRESLDTLLSCPVCFGQYVEPRILPCHHSFCKACLALVPQDIEQGKSYMKCPNCRERVEVPEGGVSKFPPSFLLNSLLDVHLNKSEEDTSTLQKNVNGPPTDSTLTCINHHKPCDIFCKDCCVAICHHCLVQQHQKHSTSLITDCYHENVNCLETKLEQVKKSISILGRATDALQRSEEKIQEQKRTIEDEVNAKADQKIHEINHCREVLLRKAQTVTERKIATINTQKDEATANIKQLKACEESIKVILKEKSKHVVLESKCHILKEVNSIVEKIDPDNYVPAEKDDQAYRPSEVNDVQILGTINGSFINESFRGFNQSIVATCNKRTSFNVIYEPGTSLLKPSSKLFSYKLTPPNSLLPACTDDDNCKVEYFEDLNVYQVHLFPTTLGPHRLVVKVGGHPIMGSPFTVHVLPTLVPNRVFKIIKSPQGIAVGKDGTIVVSESGDNKVCLFHPHGQKSSFHCPKPVGVGITNDGYIVVADESNKQVKKYSFDGQLLVELERSLSFKSVVPVVPVSRSNAPHGVTTCRDGRVFITETGSGTFYQMSSDLNVINQKSGYNTPTGIALDSKGNVYIASRSNNNVVKYNMTNGSTMTFGSRGSKDGQLRHPMDIAIDSNDTIYVADTDNNRISIFTPNGHFLKCFGQKGSGMSDLNEPCGIAVDKDGVVYVCDTGNNRVVVYQ